MSNRITKKERHLEITEETYELLNGLVKKRKFKLKIADELVSSDEVAKKALPDLKKIIRWTKASIRWSKFVLRLMPDDLLIQIKDFFGSLL
ncbi:hypothetical protein [Maridesulfovibrio zosterae]|uniref:hypothetical protein n=1 Tax=Maridesulfovibrio zosterae TaxID=82171 RepID=UPI0004267A90|nr:hypothetical protein [Maridesulfovibrio zosterae]